MGKDFLQWVEEELRHREWRNADLARRGDMSESTVSRILNGGSRVSVEFCNGVALAFGVRPEPLYRHAGLTPPLPPAAEDEAEVLHAYRRLSEQQRQVVRDALIGLVAQRVDEDTPQKWSPPTPSPAALRETGPPQEEAQLELPSRGEVVEITHDLMSLDDPLRRLIEDYISIERDPEEADRRLRILLVLAEDALQRYQDQLNEDAPEASTKMQPRRELSANDRLSDPLAKRRGI